MQNLGRTVILAAAVTFLAGSLGAQAPAPPAAMAKTPKAVAIEPVFEGGEVAKGEKLSHDFSIRNDGAVPLTITEVRPACGCTVASFDKQIAPGTIGKIHAVVDTLNLNGPVSKGLAVFTNDPANPELQLTVRVKVTPYIEVKPGYARFTVTRGLSEQAKIVETLYAPDGGMTAITGVESPYPFLIATYREAQEGEKLPDVTVKQFRVELTLRPDAPVGPMAAAVTVHTNHPKQPLAQIPISGFVRPTIAVTPPVGDFGSFTMTESFTKTLDVKNFLTEAIHVTSVDSDVKGIKAAVRPIEDGRRYVIDVTLSPGLDKGPFRGKLTIHTDSPKEPVIDVELRGTVK